MYYRMFHSISGFHSLDASNATPLQVVTTVMSQAYTLQGVILAGSILKTACEFVPAWTVDVAQQSILLLA